MKPPLSPELIASIDWTQTFTLIAAQTGACMSTVKKYAARLGVVKKRGRRKEIQVAQKEPEPEPQAAEKEIVLPPVDVPSTAAFKAEQARLEAAGWTRTQFNYLSPYSGEEHSHYVALMIQKDNEKETK